MKEKIFFSNTINEEELLIKMTIETNKDIKNQELLSIIAFNCLEGIQEKYCIEQIGEIKGTEYYEKLIEYLEIELKRLKEYK